MAVHAAFSENPPPVMTMFRVARAQERDDAAEREEAATPASAQEAAA